LDAGAGAGDGGRQGGEGQVHGGGGAFDDHLDLGLFTEITPRGLTRLVAGG